jgi:biopolymer transport protein ExbD
MLLRRQVNEERDEHIDMTPMVDVVFQLMTFMLFSVQMAAAEKVDIPPARHGVGVEENAATFLTLLAPERPGAQPKLLLGNGEGPVVTLDQVKKAVIDGVRENRRKVVLQADGNVSHGEVLKLAAAVTEIEGVTFHIGVQDPEALKYKK